jgi:uncharacterized coiled-coil protein SlyX
MRKVGIAIVCIQIIAVCCLAGVAGQAPANPAPARPVERVAPPAPRPLLGHLPPVAPEWLTAYPNEPVERLSLIYAIAEARAMIAQQRQQIAELTRRVNVLEQKMADKPIDSVQTPVDPNLNVKKP